MANVWLDHLVIGAKDLAGGVAQFHALTGIEPTRGGRHPGGGTENALVALGQGLYLEIVAPVAGARDLPPIFARLPAVGRLTPINWALAVDDADRWAEKLRRAGAEPLGPFPGSRQTPGGDLLSWRIVRFPVETWPFCIEWSAGTPHPSSTSSGGCRLAAFTIHDPRAKELSALLGKIDGLTLASAQEAGLKVVLDTPKGQVELYGP